MDGEKIKFGYGNKEQIDEQIEKGTFDGKDVIFTKDTKEICFIRPDGTKMFTKSRDDSYESIDDAITGVNDDTSTYAGQPISIKDADGKYQPYTVQNGTDGYIVEPIGLTIVEF